MTSIDARTPRDIVPTHLPVTAGDLASPQAGGRLMFLPGSPERARQIASHFVEQRIVSGTRGFDVHLGTLEFEGRRVDVGSVATGMGCPSLDIVVTELLALGVQRLLRVGTAGSLQPARVQAGHVVIATAAVRDAGSLDAYAPREVPAVASVELVVALREAAHQLGLAELTHLGLVHTKDSLYAREYGLGPRAQHNAQYMRCLADSGVLASEMEAAQLFLLAQIHSSPAVPLQSGCVLGIVGDSSPFAADVLKQRAEERAVAVALRAATTTQP